MSEYSIAADSHKVHLDKNFDKSLGSGGGYVAYNDDKNLPIDFSAVGNGDPMGYKQASIWT